MYPACAAPEGVCTRPRTTCSSGPSIRVCSGNCCDVACRTGGTEQSACAALCRLLFRLAANDPTARTDQLTHPYAPAELDRVLAVLRHLLTARTTVLAVNAAYIASAGQDDANRTEPPFQLQGSYRDMNKISARIDPVMNDAELVAVIDDHYTGEARTLTTGAESNLLKLAELRGTLTPAQTDRWAEIKATHVRNRTLGGSDEDPLIRAVAALSLLADRVSSVEAAITRATDPRSALANPAARHAQRP